MVPDDFANSNISPNAIGRTLRQNPSSVLDQYRSLTDDVALVDRSTVCRLRIEGSDAVDLLDRLSTNDLSSLSPGSGTSTVLTTNKGRVIDLMRIVHAGDHLLAFISQPARHRVMEWIEFYTFDEDVVISDITDSTFMVGVAGPKAYPAVVRQFADEVAACLPRYGLAEARVDEVPATVFRSDFLGRSEFDFIVALTEGPALAGILESRAGYAYPAALEPLRIERGIPAFGSELNEDRNPLEAGLVESISFNKGCYVGQEVVARLNTYDKVQRRLAILAWQDGTVAPGDEVFASSEQVGIVTSVSAHPRDGSVGLAYVKRAFSGDEVVLGSSRATAVLGSAPP